MSDGMGREPAYLSSHATNRYFIPNWGMNCLNAAEDRQDAPRRKRWVWLSGMAAAVVLGFFVTRLVPGSSSSDDGLRGDGQVFDGTPSEGHSSALPGDTLSADTIAFDPN